MRLNRALYDIYGAGSYWEITSDNHGILAHFVTWQNFARLYQTRYNKTDHPGRGDELYNLNTATNKMCSIFAYFL